MQTGIANYKARSWPAGPREGWVRRSFLPVAAIPLLIFGVYVFVRFVFYGNQTYPGPNSPRGERVAIMVSDRGPWPGADFHADILVYSPGGEVVAQWNDLQGQGSAQKVNELIRTLQWVREDRLQFMTAQGVVALYIGSNSWERAVFPQ